MSTITAPPAPPANFYSAKSVRGANNVQMDIFGYPIPNSLNFSSLTAPYSFLNQTTLFDVSSLTNNHEVIVVGYVSPNQIPSSTTYIVTWYRDRDNEVIFVKSWTLGDPPAGQKWGVGTSIAACIGWLSESNNGVATYPAYREIQENGNYHVEISASGGENFLQTISFAVRGIPPSTVVRNVTDTSFDWIVSLSNYFDTVDYIRVGICSEPFTNGQYDEPSGILDFNYAPSSNVGAATNGTYTGSVGTVYGFSQAPDGRYWSAGSAIVHSRPAYWEWSYLISSSGPVYSTAHFSGTTIAYIMPYYEWNNFTARVNAFKTYLGHSEVAFTQVSSGSDCTSAIINEAVEAINSSYGWQKVTPISGSEIPASVFIHMRDALNSIL